MNKTSTQVQASNTGMPTDQRSFIERNKTLVALAATALFFLMGTYAMASGSDNTFGTVTATGGTGPVGTLSSWLKGSMGQMFSIGALAVGLGVGIVKQSVMSVAVGTGIALAASAGPGVLGAIFAAAI